MDRTMVMAFRKKEKAQEMANLYSDDHNVVMLGPTAEVGFLCKGDEREPWPDKSGPYYVVVATKTPLAGPI